jgi:hypothetical protein
MVSWFSFIITLAPVLRRVVQVRTFDNLHAVGALPYRATVKRVDFVAVNVAPEFDLVVLAKQTLNPDVNHCFGSCASPRHGSS